MIRLIRFDDGVLNLLKEEIALTPEFKAIFDADKSKDKNVAFSAIAYVSLMASAFSQYAGLSEKEQMNKCVAASKMASNLVTNPLVKEAIAAFVELEETMFPPLKMFKSMKNGLNRASDVINVLVESMDKKLEVVKKNAKDNPDAIMDVSSIIADVATLLSLSEKIDKTLITFDKLSTKIENQLVDNVEVRGKHKTGMFEND